jgi:hypothetical protein
MKNRDTCFQLLPQQELAGNFSQHEKNQVCQLY